MADDVSKKAEQQQERQESLFSKIFWFPITFIGVMFSSLFLAIVVFPLINLLVRNREQRTRIAQQTVGQRSAVAIEHHGLRGQPLAAGQPHA